MHKKVLKFALVVELAKPKFTYITVLKWPKLGHIAKSGKQALLSRSSGPWLSFKSMDRTVDILIAGFCS